MSQTDDSAGSTSVEANAEDPTDAVAIARRSGEELIRHGAWSEAATTLEQAAMLAPNDVDLLVDLGNAYMLSHDPAKARTAFERAAALRPEEYALQYSLAQIYQALGEPEIAAPVLLLMARRVSSPRLLSELTLLLFQLKRWSEAEKVFVQLQKLDPEHDLVVLHGRIWCHIQKRDWRSAFDVALETTRLDRYSLTTALLAYAKDRLFSRVPDALEQEAALGARVMAELRDHVDVHSTEDIFGGLVAAKGEDHG